MKLKLREIRIEPTMHKGHTGFLLSDPLYLSSQALFIPGPLAELLVLMDGTRNIEAVKTGFELRTGVPLNNSLLEGLISQLDEALLLDNKRYATAYTTALNEYRGRNSRLPVLSGRCYPADTGELSTLLGQYFDWAEKVSPKPPSEVSGLICPHIDYSRGADIYARIWFLVKEAVRKADLIVILGTDHNEGTGRITLTRQSYETPWGVIPTAGDAVQELVDEIGDEALLCELNHRREHSIEAALIWLHYLMGDKPFSLLPVLCGSFQPFIEKDLSPREVKNIESTIEVLTRLSNRYKTVMVAAADLAHVGPVFGDSLKIDITSRSRMAEQDEELMAVINKGNAENFFELIRKEGDRRHVCGVPPIYILLSVLAGIEGKTLGYSQCPASEDGTSLVSICGTIF